MSDLRHDIVETSIANFARELEIKILDGWRICPTNPGAVIGLYGGNFTVTVIRDAQSLARVQQKLETVTDRPKAGGTLSLAKARAKKAENAAIKAQSAKKGDA